MLQKQLWEMHKKYAKNTAAEAIIFDELFEKL
jgi:hypothetical protein